MPLSTSNFEPVPAGRSWLKAWSLAILLAAGILGGWEALWRSRGLGPLFGPDETNWARLRLSVDERSSILLGTSRAQAAVDPRAWPSSVGITSPRHLTLQGNSALPVLRHLAESDDKMDLVLVGITPHVEFAANSISQVPAEYLQAYRDMARSPAKRIEATLWSLMETPVYRRTGLSLYKLLENLRAGIQAGSLRGVLPGPTHWSRRSDRFTPLDFSKIDASARRLQLLASIEERTVPLSRAAMDTVLAAFERYSSELRRRGATVVVVHLPHCEEMRAFEDELFPRQDYWDRLAERFPGSAIHFADHPSLSGFECPDGSHLDQRDVPPFTESLAAVVDSLLHGG